MSRLIDANTKPASRIGKHDKLCGLPTETLEALNAKMLTKSSAQRIYLALKDYIGVDSKWEVRIILSNRRTVNRFGTIFARDPLFVHGEPAGRYKSRIILYRWSMLVLVHELAHLKNYVDHGRFVSHSHPDFYRTMAAMFSMTVDGIGDGATNERDAKTAAAPSGKSEAVLELLKNDSLSARDIAWRVDSTEKSVQSIVCRLRKLGHAIECFRGLYHYEYPKVGIGKAKLALDT